MNNNLLFVQGNVIGPLLFMLFINDITLLFSGRKCAFKLYADDLKLTPYYILIYRLPQPAR